MKYIEIYNLFSRQYIKPDTKNKVETIIKDIDLLLRLLRRSKDVRVEVIITTREDMIIYPMRRLHLVKIGILAHYEYSHIRTAFTDFVIDVLVKEGNVQDALGKLKLRLKRWVKSEERRALRESTSILDSLFT